MERSPEPQKQNLIYTPLQMQITPPWTKRSVGLRKRTNEILPLASDKDLHGRSILLLERFDELIIAHGAVERLCDDPWWIHQVLLEIWLYMDHGLAGLAITIGQMPGNWRHHRWTCCRRFSSLHSKAHNVRQGGSQNSWFQFCPQVRVQDGGCHVNSHKQRSSSVNVAWQPMEDATFQETGG